MNNSEQSLDLWQEISMPQWMICNRESQFQQIVFPDEKNMQKEKKQVDTIIRSPQPNQQKFKRSISFTDKNFNFIGCEQIENKIINQNFFCQQNGQIQKKVDSKSKIQRMCENSRKYRQRKKEYLKSLENQNKFLKFKVDQLTFKVHQMEKEISRLKHNDQQNKQSNQSFHTAKQKCIEQLQQMLSKNQVNDKQLYEAALRLKHIESFDAKQKIEYLNYFMSELLQNILQDKKLYFIDCLLNKRGVHRQGDTKLRRIDIQVIDILNIPENKIKEAFFQNQKQYLTQQFGRVKELWKKLYQVYLAFLNQGAKIQRIIQPTRARIMNYVKITDFLRLQLHFEKNKYRSDIRYVRNSWFKQLEEQQVQGQKSIEDYPTKKQK